MTTIATWKSAQLPAGYQGAHLSAHRDGGYIFRAWPHRGDDVIECISRDLDDVRSKADRWAAGEKNVPGIYGASGW